MTERLSDERLLLISEDAQCVSGSLEIKAMARELLELRAKPAAGPVMPETPSEDVLSRASKSCVFSVFTFPKDQARLVYLQFRAALAKEQGL